MIKETVKASLTIQRIGKINCITNKCKFISNKFSLSVFFRIDLLRVPSNCLGVCTGVISSFFLLLD